jgi:hypothetical protein
MAQDAEDGPETLFSASSDSQYFINATRLPMNQVVSLNLIDVIT